MKHKFRIWAGPTGVDGYADMIEAEGLEVTCRGTEHVHVLVRGHLRVDAREHMFATLRAPFGSSRAATMAFSSECIGEF